MCTIKTGYICLLSLSFLFSKKNGPMWHKGKRQDFISSLYKASY